MILTSTWVDASIPFWENLRRFLGLHYPPNVAHRIAESMYRDHLRYVHSLSLDDLERLAQQLWSYSNSEP